MPSNSRDLMGLNWTALVDETLRRRKKEKLTQKSHAALAGVSIPTMASFERGETKLTLGKAMDILRVVGLVQEVPPDDAQGLFVQQALRRWNALTAHLPNDAPARFPHGYYRIDYYYEGTLNASTPEALLRHLTRTNDQKHSGWPPFRIPARDSAKPDIIENTIECWLGRGKENEESFPFTNDAAHCDYWRASTDGRMFLISGHREDSGETFPAGQIFDSILSLTRLGEILLHAARLGRMMSGDDDLKLHFRAQYTGLRGRQLRSWANPMITFPEEGTAARGDEAYSEMVIAISDIENNLEDVVTTLIAPLYERFNTKVQKIFVAAQLNQLKSVRL